MLLHERWFTLDQQFPVQFDAMFTARTWIPVGIALAVTAVVVLLWRLRGGRDFVPGPLELGMRWDRYEELLTRMPLVLGLHTAVTLLVSGIGLHLLVPNLALDGNFIGALFGLAQIAVALAFIYGALTRIAAVTLAATWLGGAIYFGPVRLLEHSLFLGIAFFLFVAGRGTLSLDESLDRLHRPVKRLMPYAVPTLRMLTGFSIVVVAFTEKLWNIPMGLAFLSEHHFNFFPSLGFAGVSDTQFLLIAGTVELVLGCLLMSGAFVRLLIIGLWIPFNLTLPLLGWRELIGHLPIYGIMLLLLIWGEDRPETGHAMEEGIDRGTDDSERVAVRR